MRGIGMVKHISVLMVIVFGFVLSVVGGAQKASAQSTDYASYSFNVGVFSDDDSSATQESTEVFLANWDVVFYDSSFNQIHAALSTEAVDTHNLIQYPTYICLQPQDGWLLTSPTTGSYFPSSTWDCHVVGEQPSEVYLFGVYLNPVEVGDIPEDLGEIVTLQNNAPGEVLGTTTDAEPEVLAETGDPVLYAAISGIAILTTALALGRKKLILEK